MLGRNRKILFEGDYGTEKGARSPSALEFISKPCFAVMVALSILTRADRVKNTIFAATQPLVLVQFAKTPHPVGAAYVVFPVPGVQGKLPQTPGCILTLPRTRKTDNKKSRGHSLLFLLSNCKPKLRVGLPWYDIAVSVSGSSWSGREYSI